MILTPFKLQTSFSLSILFSRGVKKSSRMVDVVLLKDHETLGSKGKIAKVKPGFARNFLYPQGIVVYATNENIVKYAATKTAPSLNLQ